MSESDTQFGEPPQKLRWFQFSLRSMFGLTAVVAVILGFSLEARSIRQSVEQQVMTSSMEHASTAFFVQRGMVEERLCSRLYCPSLKEVLAAGEDVKADHDRLHIVVAWDFSYDREKAPDSIRKEIRSCLLPIYWLDSRKTLPGWNWDIQQKTDFVKDRQRGKITVTAECRRIGR
jgi:hypothetical protein